MCARRFLFPECSQDLRHDRNGNMTIKYLLNDDAVFVIDKPAGMPAVSLLSDEKGTLASLILAENPAQADVGENPLEAGLVNRIDNDTSGIVVGARTKDAYEKLRKQFTEGDVIKEYEALVIGRVEKDGKIKTQIAHHPGKKNRMIACESKDVAIKNKARPAVTEYFIKERFKKAENEYTLLRVLISTGVRHQIRVHLASLGHPLSGDSLYRNLRKKAADGILKNRHFLHASRIVFFHPVTLHKIDVSCPLSKELKKVIGDLERCG